MSTKTGRNDPCPCGSGKKYKKCCLPVGVSAEVSPVHASAPAFDEGLEYFADAHQTVRRRHVLPRLIRSWDIPAPSVTFEEVQKGLAEGKRYWTMKGEPKRRTSRVEVYYAAVEDFGEGPEAGVHYVGGRWADEDDLAGEEGWESLEDMASEIEGLLWHEVASDGAFHPCMTPEYTVRAILGLEP